MIWTIVRHPFFGANTAEHGRSTRELEKPPPVSAIACMRFRLSAL